MENERSYSADAQTMAARGSGLWLLCGQFLGLLGLLRLYNLWQTTLETNPGLHSFTAKCNSRINKLIEKESPGACNRLSFSLLEKLASREK